MARSDNSLPSEKAVAVEIRDTLYGLESRADTENLRMLAHLLREAIEEATEIIGDKKALQVRIADLGKRE